MIINIERLLKQCVAGEGYVGGMEGLEFYIPWHFKTPAELEKEVRLSVLEFEKVNFYLSLSKKLG